MHPGLIGCLPPRKCSNTWNTREKELFDTDPERVPPLCALPSAGTAHMGRMTGAARDAAAAEGARTVPPREHGGNCDIKNLTRAPKSISPSM